MTQDNKDEKQTEPSKPQDIATAYRELTKGEQTATQLEANLTNLESKLDAMLAAFEQQNQTQGGGSGSEKKDANGGGSEKKA